jgi:hypothetical protein
MGSVSHKNFHLVIGFSSLYTSLLSVICRNPVCEFFPKAEKKNIYILNPNFFLVWVFFFSLETAETFDRLLEEAGERLVYLFYL